jgi:hypothetical protein
MAALSQLPSRRLASVVCHAPNERRLWLRRPVSLDDDGAPRDRGRPVAILVTSSAQGHEEPSGRALHRGDTGRRVDPDRANKTVSREHEVFMEAQQLPFAIERVRQMNHGEQFVVE